MQLDLRTLSLNIVVFSLIFGFGLLAYAKKHRIFKGVSLIGLGHLAIGCGIILLGLRHTINDFTSVVIANTVTYIGVMLIFRGLLCFLHISMSCERFILPLLVFAQAGLLYYYKFNTPDINARIIIVSGFSSVLCFIIAYTLTKSSEEHSRGAIRLLLAMFLVIAIFHLFRASASFYQEQLHDFMKSGMASSLAIISSELLVAVTSFSTIIIATDRLQNSLAEMARTDPLTKLYNRRTFEEYCDVEYSRSNRTGSTFAIIICDLDHFKRVNDHYGHQTGDNVLKIFASLLNNNIRRQDVAARYGGEEFVILLPDTDTAKGLIVAEHLRLVTQSTTIADDVAANLTITSSFGVAHNNSNDTEWRKVLNRADKALYSAKNQGRNRTVGA